MERTVNGLKAECKGLELVNEKTQAQLARKQAEVARLTDKHKAANLELRATKEKQARACRRFETCLNSPTLHFLFLG